MTNCTVSNDQAKTEASMVTRKRIILIGASVGKAWNLPEYPQRVNDTSHIFESLVVYQYDKTGALEEILMRPKRKFRLTLSYVKGFFQPSPQVPKIIIIKECSSYFPGDSSLYKEFVKSWVKRIRDAHIQVILTTIVPVTRERAEKGKGKMEAIAAYNDWIREYARNENVVLLDLEAALRKSAKERFLQDELTSGDGTHLNKKAYDILDKLLQKTLQSKT